MSERIYMEGPNAHPDPAVRDRHIRRYIRAAVMLGKRGGLKRWQGISTAERSTIMRRVIQARWAPVRAAQRAGTGDEVSASEQARQERP